MTGNNLKKQGENLIIAEVILKKNSRITRKGYAAVLPGVYRITISGWQAADLLPEFIPTAFQPHFHG